MEIPILRIIYSNACLVSIRRRRSITHAFDKEERKKFQINLLIFLPYVRRV